MVLVMVMPHSTARPGEPYTVNESRDVANLTQNPAFRCNMLNKLVISTGTAISIDDTHVTKF